MIKSIAS